MIIHSKSKNLIYHLIGAFAVWVSHDIAVFADGVDPTTPSSQITDLLRMHGGALTGPDKLKEHDENRKGNEPSIDRPVLRLKAIVLRDQDHGTAIISNNEIEIYVITLRRTDLQDTSRALSIGGISLMVKDFSESSVTMQSLDKTQQFIIN